MELSTTVWQPSEFRKYVHASMVTAFVLLKRACIG